jgi:hypothetical protein
MLSFSCLLNGSKADGSWMLHGFMEAGVGDSMKMGSPFDKVGTREIIFGDEFS